MKARDFEDAPVDWNREPPPDEVFGDAGLAIFVTDSSGRVTYRNAAAKALGERALAHGRFWRGSMPVRRPGGCAATPDGLAVAVMEPPAAPGDARAA